MTTQYFSNASNFNIGNLTISHVNGNAVTNGRSVESERQGEMAEHSGVARGNNSTGSRERHGLTRLLDNISQGAFHDAAERGDRPKCHRHTRVAIRAEIMQWISASNAQRKLIIWMYGPAGSGKTAIAQSIAEACAKAASFFFSRTAAGRNDTTRFEDAMLTTIERDPTIFSRAIATQMRVLIVEPLKALPHLPQPIFVILDGLDEAGPTPEAQADLLHIIGTATEELRHIPLICLIASRPEYEIREAFNGPLNPLTQSLVLDDNYKPDDDIRLYLTSTFEKILKQHSRTRPRLPSPWPSESDVDRLVSKASGQFIFAATVLKFVDSIRHHPAERLDVIFSLSARGHGSETPFALLDALYHHILSSVAEPAKVRQILTILVLKHPASPLYLDQIEIFLDLDVRRVLVDIHALVFVPPPSDYEAKLRFHHASLFDFLMDRSRSHHFYIDANQAHIDLTCRWWKVIFNNQYSTQLDLHTCLHHFVHHCPKSPAGIKLTDDFACFNLRQLLENHCDSDDLLSLPWEAFFECVKQQARDREDVSRRMEAEFDAFFLDCLSKYPPALQTYMPTVLALPFNDRLGGLGDVIRLLLCGFTQSVTECDNICKLDSMLLNLATHEFTMDTAFSTLFQDECRAGEYYVCDRSYLALANRIIGVILPQPGENKRQIKFEEVSYPELNKQVLYLKDGYLHLRLYSLAFAWFPVMLGNTPKNLDLAALLRERVLQYDGRSTELKEGRRWINIGSLKYVQVKIDVTVPYHIKSTSTPTPQAPTGFHVRRPTRASSATSVSPPLQVNGTPSPTLPSVSEASPKKLKRKRESQTPPAELRRSTRLKVKKTAS
ncbi:hypothetical protein BJ912DRAFT_1141437 [Pholiota molesta]|nr:hypothetical protein BJ912DRAFT_1141437 [Pholiota molesta]